MRKDLMNEFRVRVIRVGFVLYVLRLPVVYRLRSRTARIQLGKIFGRKNEVGLVKTQTVKASRMGHF
jgi:hypothetical protein